jgi:carbon storage regulator CsrA
MIGDNIEIVITYIGGDKIKMAVVAPENIRIFRKEIYGKESKPK